MDEQGLQDSAILLMSLGEAEAAAVFQHLTPKEVQRLGETIAHMRSVSRERVDTVLNRFSEAAGALNLLVRNNDDYVRTVLKKALGEDKASLLLDRILHGNDVSGIEGLKWMDPDAVAELLRAEHPQIAAAILVHLDAEQSAAVLKGLPEDLRSEVMLRIATLEGIQPVALRDLNEILDSVLSGGDRIKRTSMGGVETAAEIMNLLGSQVESGVMESLRAHDADLAQAIQDKMFVFDDLLKLNNTGMQRLLREVQSDMLLIALKGAGQELMDKVLSNMSSRAAETLKEDLESKGPVRLTEVEVQQKEILKMVRQLAESGEIALGGGAEEDAFV